MIAITPVLKTEYEAVTDLWERSVRTTHHFLTEENILYFRPLILNNYLDAVELYCVRDPAGFYKKMGFFQTGYSELDGSGKPFPLIHMEIVTG